MLVPRVYEVVEGAVRVDGIDVRELTQDSLHAAVGLVAQDPHLFHDSIGANLRFARPDATDAEVEHALQAARLWDFVLALPAGLDTIVGERGYRMSGGEKQRLAIARVLLKDPAIVILDEATSHLDSTSEVAIQDALEEALRGRTAVVIAHRLSTVVSADRILVVDAGRIVETGTHEQLLARRGPVRRSVPQPAARPRRDGLTPPPGDPQLGSRGSSARMRAPEAAPRADGSLGPDAPIQHCPDPLARNLPPNA